MSITGPKRAKSHRYSMPEASATDPIYPGGFAVGVTRSTNSSKSTADSRLPTSSNQPAKSEPPDSPELAAFNAYEQAISMLGRSMGEASRATFAALEPSTGERQEKSSPGSS